MKLPAALLTRMSSGPAAKARASMVSTAATSRTSQTWVPISAPSSRRNSSAVAASTPSRRPQMVRCAPSSTKRRPIDLPSPVPPPVMSARLPASSPGANDISATPSSQSQAAGDDAAQDFLGAAAQGEARRVQDRLRQQFRIGILGIERRLDRVVVPHHFGDLLLQHGADVLHHRGLQVG